MSIAMPRRSELGEFKGIYRGTIRSVSDPFLISTAIFIAGQMVSTLISGSFSDLVGSAHKLIYLIFGFAALFIFYSKYHWVRVYSSGLEGKNYNGATVRFYWNEIESMRHVSRMGFESVVVVERATKKEIWIYRDVFYGSKFQKAVGSNLNRLAS